MNNGFVKMPRTLIDARAWKSHHTHLTPFEAYADLLQMAYYGREPMVRHFNREQITLRAGQLVGSLRFMAERWGWTVYQVKKQLSEWVKTGLISTLQTKLNTIYVMPHEAKSSTSADDEKTDGQTTIQTSSQTSIVAENALFADFLEEPSGESQTSLRPSGQTNNKKIAKEEEEITKDSNLSKARACVRTSEVPRRRSRTAFIPPTREQVEAYCMQQGIRSVDASRFVDYYEANGWHVGSHPMRSWQATVRNWNRRAWEATLPSVATPLPSGVTIATPQPSGVTVLTNPQNSNLNTIPNVNPIRVPTTPQSSTPSSTGSTAGSTAAPRIAFPTTFPSSKRTACAEALVSYQARQARRVASMDAQEPDF